MKYIKEFINYFPILEHSKNDPIPELSREEKLCVIVMGAPAVGKSTFINDIVLKNNKDIKVFSSDDISFRYTKSQNKRHKNSGKLTIKKVNSFIETGNSFVYDTVGTQKEDIKDIILNSKDSGYRVIIIHLFGTLERSLELNKERERNAEDTYIKYAYNTQQSNINFYYDLDVDNYYIIVYTDRDKFKYYKYNGSKILKRKVDTYK